MVGLGGGGDSWEAGTGKWDRKTEAKVTAPIEATVQYGGLPSRASEEPIHRFQERTAPPSLHREGVTPPSLLAGEAAVRKKGWQWEASMNKGLCPFTLFPPHCPNPEQLQEVQEPPYHLPTINPSGHRPGIRWELDRWDWSWTELSFNIHKSPKGS